MRNVTLSNFIDHKIYINLRQEMHLNAGDWKKCNTNIEFKIVNSIVSFSEVINIINYYYQLYIAVNYIRKLCSSRTLMSLMSIFRVTIDCYILRMLLYNFFLNVGSI